MPAKRSMTAEVSSVLLLSTTSSSQRMSAGTVNALSPSRVWASNRDRFHVQMATVMNIGPGYRDLRLVHA